MDAGVACLAVRLAARMLTALTYAVSLAFLMIGHGERHVCLLTCMRVHDEGTLASYLMLFVSLRAVPYLEGFACTAVAVARLADVRSWFRLDNEKVNAKL